MTAGTASPQAEHGFLLLADISGYTAFLEMVAVAHPEMVQPGGPVPPAYAVMSSLLDAVVERLSPTFSLSEIEGDAVFAYALDRTLEARPIDALLDVLHSSYAGFRARIDEAMVVHRHDCRACILLPSLEFKFVLHHGSFVMQPVAGRVRLLGPAVNMAHRLLKNTIAETTGRKAYLLVTDAASAQLDLDAAAGLDHFERYPDVGAVHGRILSVSRG